MLCRSLTLPNAETNCNCFQALDLFLSIFTCSATSNNRGPWQPNCLTVGGKVFWVGYLAVLIRFDCKWIINSLEWFLLKYLIYIKQTKHNWPNYILSWKGSYKDHLVQLYTSPNVFSKNISELEGQGIILPDYNGKDKNISISVAK